MYYGVREISRILFLAVMKTGYFDVAGTTGAMVFKFLSHFPFTSQSCSRRGMMYVSQIKIFLPFYLLVFVVLPLCKLSVKMSLFQLDCCPHFGEGLMRQYHLLRAELHLVLKCRVFTALICDSILPRASIKFKIFS